MQIIHEDLLEQFFTAENAVAICEVIGTNTLEHAIDKFEDTRTELEVNEMCDELQHIFKVKMCWDDEREVYVY